MSYNKVTANGYGTANFWGNLDPHPDFLVRVILGAVEARQAWLDANDAAKPLISTWKASSRAIVAERGKLRPGATSPELQAAEEDHREHDAALARNGRAAKRLAEAYDRLVQDAERPPVQELAAAEALTRHKKVADALAVLTENYPHLRTAFVLAGRPGRDPINHNGTFANRLDGGFKESLAVLEVLVRYDLGDLEAVANGGQALSQADKEALAREATAEHNNSTIRAHRDRARIQGIIADNATRAENA